jgi:hypothetical protein
MGDGFLAGADFLFADIFISFSTTIQATDILPPLIANLQIAVFKSGEIRTAPIPGAELLPGALNS